MLYLPFRGSSQVYIKPSAELPGTVAAFLGNVLYTLLPRNPLAKPDETVGRSDVWARWSKTALTILAFEALAARSRTPHNHIQ